MHVLQQASDYLLVISDFLLVLGFLRVKLSRELLYLFLLLVKDLKLLRLLVVFLLLLSLQLVCDVFDVALVLLVHFSDFTDLLLLLFDLSVVLLDPIHQPLACLWERKIHFVSLQFQVFFPLGQVGFLVSQMLSALFQSISSQALISLSQPHVDIVELLP